MILDFVPSTHLSIPLSDPDEDPFVLFLFSAQNGLISGMERALSRNPQILFMCDTFETMSALHVAAASHNPRAVDAVRWLLDKGIPWSARDGSDRLPEELARGFQNDESCTVLRNWAINFGNVDCAAVSSQAASLLSLWAHRIRVILQVEPKGGPSR